MLTLRASGLPMAFLCPGSAHVPEVRIDPRSAPADLGNAAHEALRPVVEGRGVQWEDLPAIAARWGVDEVELRVLVATGAKLWPLVADRFPLALTEVELTAEIPGPFDVLGHLSGHLDILARVDRTIEIADWKTGRKDADYGEQVRGYMALALLDDETALDARATVLWLREGDAEVYTMTRSGALSWMARLVEEVALWDGTFRPGDHCGRCKRNHECPAARALARRDVGAILGVDVETSIAAMPAADVVTLYKQAAQVEALAKRVRAAVKARVEEDGDLAADGARLTIQVEHRAALDIVKAWPVLEAAGFGDEDFAACVEVSPAKARDVVAKRAGKGKGAAAVRALDEALVQADAVRAEQVRKLVVRR